MANKPGSRDYTDLHEDGEKPDVPEIQRNEERRWWEKTGQVCAQRIAATLQHLKRAQEARIRAVIGYARLYTSSDTFGGYTTSSAALLSQRWRAGDRQTYSAVQSIIDTLTSRVGETKPRPYFLTSGGNYKQQRKAKKLNQLVEGIFYEAKTYDIGIECFRDGAIVGDGFMHVFPDHQQNKVRMERVSAGELWIDEIEAQYGFPRTMYRDKSVDRDELIALVRSLKYDEEKTKKLEREIQAANPANLGNRARQDDVSDMVRVVACWKLGVPQKDGTAKGGYYSLCLPDRDVMLCEPEPWEYNFFPFARFSWAKRPFGYWSQGVCERRAQEQRELNKRIQFISTAMQRASKLWVWLPNASKVSTEQINNDIGTIIRGNEKPEWYTPQPIHEVYIKSIPELISYMEREEGVSQMAVSGRKEPGVNSGRAMRELEDQASERFRALQRSNDNFYLDIAYLAVAFAGELKSLKVRVPGKTTFNQIDYAKDIQAVKDDEFVLQCYPVNRLPRDPAGRYQTIQEWVQAGWLNPRQARRLMDFPDLDSVETLANAQEELVQKRLDAIVDDGEYSTPEPTDDLDVSKELVLWYINRYQLLDLESERMDMLRDYNSQVDELTDVAKQQAKQQQVAQQPVPQGAPAPAPQSELMQQVA